jgi:hypothetical protein
LLDPVTKLGLLLTVYLHKFLNIEIYIVDKYEAQKP